MHKNVIEGLTDLRDNGGILGIQHVKLQLRMHFARNIDQGRTEVDTNAVGRFQCSERISYPAADIENTYAFRDEKAQVGFVFPVKKGRSLPELGASSRIGLRVRENRGLAGCGTRLFHDQLKDHFAVSVKLS